MELMLIKSVRVQKHQLCHSTQTASTNNAGRKSGPTLCAAILRKTHGGSWQIHQISVTAGRKLAILPYSSRSKNLSCTMNMIRGCARRAFLCIVILTVYQSIKSYELAFSGMIISYGNDQKLQFSIWEDRRNGAKPENRPHRSR